MIQKLLPDNRERSSHDSGLHLIVPKDPVENLRWRLKIRRWADADHERQSHLLKACKEDLLFFFNGFCWLFEPRIMGDLDASKIIPFATWPHQDPIIRQIRQLLGRRDIGVEKSRGEGMTWIVLLIFLHSWLFDDMSSFGAVSRNLLAADNPEDPDSLMWKLDWELAMLPPWMVPGFNRTINTHTLRNLQNHSTIVAYSCTEDIGRGGRKTAFFMDELASFPRGADERALASTQHVTQCRILVSTPYGNEGAYYRVMHEDSTIAKMVMDWKDNPTRNRSLYRLVKETPTPFSEKDPLSADYTRQWPTISKRLADRGYDLDNGCLRSPWYDAECLRPGANPRLIAQELDRDYGGSASRFFGIGMIERLQREHCRPPLHVGELLFDAEEFSPTWMDSVQGRLRLWRPLGETSRRPPPADYIIGCDVASGAGGVMSSNSVLSVLDAQTGHKAAEFVSPRTLPNDLANYAIALCNFFRGDNGPAYLIWETDGPGIQFSARVFETEFRNYYHRTVTEEVSRRPTRKVGFSMRARSKLALLGQYAADLAEGKYINPCREALEECKQYVRGPDGVQVYHVASVTAEDPAGARAAHGDRVIADALSNWVRYEQRRRPTSPRRVNVYGGGIRRQDIPAGCWLERRMEYLDSRKRRPSWGKKRF